MIKYVEGDSMYDSYDRDDKTIIYKEDVLRRIDHRMSMVIDCTEDPVTRHELLLLKSFLLATIADMQEVADEVLY